jgi:HlyD family type I secretion membrane fusion protein
MVDTTAATRALVPSQGEKPPPNNPWPTLLTAGVIIFGSFGLGAVWLGMAPLDSATIASGVVAVESNRRTIQHLEGGIVREILVKDGQLVNEGDVLLRLDPIRARTQMNVVQNEMDSVLAIEARLTAEQSGAARIVFPPELTARKGEPILDSVMRTQELIFAARKEALDGQKAILQQRINQLNEQIAGLRSLEQSKKQQNLLIRDELNGLKTLLDEGHVTKSRVLALQREESRLQGEAGDHVSSIVRTQQAVNEARLQLLQSEKARQEEIATQLRDVQSRILEQRERVIAARDVLARVDVTAPSSGAVLGLTAFTIGGVIQPGAPILSIVPQDDPLIVEAQINAPDASLLHVGQTATLIIVGAEARVLPSIEGVLVSISADRQVDQRTGASVFQAKIEIPKEELKRLGTFKLTAGLPVEVLIKRGERTAIQYLTQPLTDRLNRAFREY